LQSYNKRLRILTDEERLALYSTPEFSNEQQKEYFRFTKDEIDLIFSRTNISAQIYCALQIGYFKAKQLFFEISWVDILNEDVNFLIKEYFGGKNISLTEITKYEYYTQVKQIAEMNNYSLWSNKFREILTLQIIKTSKKDMNIKFILTELICFLFDKRIVLPGYSTLQKIMSESLNNEYARLENIMSTAINEDSKIIIEKLLIRDDMLSYLSVLKQDAKDFKYKMMSIEREKLLTIKPLYKLAKQILPTLGISKKNILYHADLVNHYTIFELRRFKQERLYLYILCYIWQRYMQLTDNLVSAFGHHLKKFDDKTKELAENKFSKKNKSTQKETPIVGQLLNLYTDENISDDIPFGEIRKKYAFRLMEKERLKNKAEQMSKKPLTEHLLRWNAVNKNSRSFKLNLRPIFIELDFDSYKSRNNLLLAIKQLKKDFLENKQLTRKSNIENYINIIPKKLRKYLLIQDKSGKVNGIQSNRYEFWIYSKIRSRLESGELYLDDSISHRCFEHELIPVNDDTLKDINLLSLQQPIEKQLNTLSQELKNEWILFNEVLKENKSEHIKYNEKDKKISFHKPKTNKVEEPENTLYEKLTPVDIVDVLHFVDKKCNFLSAFNPIQNRYVKNKMDKDSILAVLISQSMNHGLSKFSKIADIDYDHLRNVYSQYFRIAVLKEANKIISNFMKNLPIFKYYSYNLSTLYGSVDGQKLKTQTPTIKARHSKKYFGREKGLVSIGLLVNHNLTIGYTISPNEHESYFVFDLHYNNTTDIIPDAITGDMHSINKANFAILHWFDTDFRPRFTDLKAQLKHLYCDDEISNYQNFRVKPIRSFYYTKK